jgi:membrane associated rhomboid family serine protease
VSLRFEIEDPARPRRLDAFKDLAAAAVPVAATVALITANVAVYVVMVAKGVSPVTPTTDALLRFGANYEPWAKHGQLWRVVTSTFVHVGIVHLLMNMAALWSVGRIMEPLCGWFDLVLLYLLTGISGSLTGMVVHPLIVSAGASGAIFGLFGALTGAVIASRQSMPIAMRVTLLKYALTFTVMNFVYGLTQKNIDLAAHVGGFVVGVPIGVALFAGTGVTRGVPLRRRAIVAVSVIALQAVVAARVPTIDDWFGELTRITDLDAANVAAYNDAANKLIASTISAEEFSRTVDRLLVPWDQERAKLLSLTLPKSERGRAESLGRYMSLRAETWRLRAAGARSHDATVLKAALLKDESALEALQEFSPTVTIAERLKTLRTQRAAQEASDQQREAARAHRRAEADAFSRVLKRVNASEHDSVKTINESLAKLRAREMSPAQVADVIELQVLPRWSTQRAQLAEAHVPDGQTEFHTNLLRYMALKNEGWSAMAAALRTNDSGLAQESRRKEQEASRLATAMTHH